MKRIGFLALASLLVFSGCSGDLFPPSDNLPPGSEPLPDPDPGPDPDPEPEPDPEPDPDPPATPPTVNVVFPPLQSITDASVITVRGSASDADGVAAIRVNGLLAETTNGFQDWHVEVPLGAEENTLLIESEDSAGAIDREAAALTVRSRPVVQLSNPSGIIMDPSSGRGLISDLSLDAVVAVDLTSGRRQTMSDGRIGSGPALRWPGRGTLDLANNRILLCDSFDIMVVDLATGDRADLSDLIGGSGPSFFAEDLELDATNNRLLVADNIGRAVVQIDLATGVRSIVSSDEIGAGPTFQEPGGMVLDLANNRVLLADWYHDRIVAVDLTTGDRTSISDGETGSGPVLDNPLDLALDTANNRLLAIENRLEATTLWAVDLATLERTSLGTWYYGRPRHLALDTAGNRVLITHADSEHIMTVDLATYDASFLFDDLQVGSGRALSSMDDIHVDSAKDRLLVVQGRRLLGVDMATGERANITEISWPHGTTNHTVWDAVNNQLYTITFFDGELTVIDPTTGEFTTLSHNRPGEGPVITRPVDLALDRPRDRALVLDWVMGSTPAVYSVIAIDLASGERTTLSGVEAGAGPMWRSPDAMILDQASNRALVFDSYDGALLAIDLETGDRTILADEAGGTGPAIAGIADMVLDRTGDRLVMLAGDRVMTMDPSSGDRETLGAGEDDRGPRFWSPERMALDAASNRLLVMDTSLRAIFTVDVTTGERVISSR